MQVAGLDTAADQKQQVANNVLSAYLYVHSAS